MFELFRRSPPLNTQKRTLIELLANRFFQLVPRERLSNVRILSASDSMFQSAGPATFAESIARYFDTTLGLKVEPAQLEGMITLEDPLRDAVDCARFCATRYLVNLETKWDDSNFILSDPRTAEIALVGLGWGAILSDACLYSQSWNDGHWEYHEWSSTGNLNAEEIGYSIAVFCQLLECMNGDWKRILRADARVTFARALKHFNADRHGEPFLFDLELLPDESTTDTRICEYLESKRPEIVLATLWHLKNREALSAEVTEAVLAASRLDDQFIQLESTCLLEDGVLSPGVKQRIEQLISHRKPSIAIAAIQAALTHGFEMSDYMKIVCALFIEWSSVKSEDAHRWLMKLVRTIHEIGEPASEMDFEVAQYLKRFLGSEDVEALKELTECLVAISPDPAQIVRKVFNEGPKLEIMLRCLEGQYPNSNELIRLNI